MIEMQITRRRLLQAGGVVMVSSLLPLNALAGSGQQLYCPQCRR